MEKHEPNKYVAELYKRASDRYSIETKNMSYGDWICANTHLKGRNFNFDRYSFQEQIVNDMHPNLCVIKLSQIGLTEVQIRKALAFITRNRGTNLIFTFPDDEMRKRQSQTRISPIVESEKVFNLGDGERPIRSISLIQIGNSFMHVTGSKESDATSTSADVVMNDEVDLTDQEMLATFGSRLQGSDWKINQQFSTPTYTGFGIDLQYENSDQHEYMIKCDCCNHWQAPLFDLKWVSIPGLNPDINDLREIDQGMLDKGQIDLLNSEVVCERCRAPLDLGRKEIRAWVPKHPGRSHSRGYKVSPFSTKTLNVQYIVEQLLKYKMRDATHRWENTVLGQAVDTSNARLSVAEIKACITGYASRPPINRDIPTWIGGDIGLTCHITVGQGYDITDIKVVWMFTCPVGELDSIIKDLCETFFVAGGLLDRHPYTPTVEGVRTTTMGVVLPCDYRGTKELHYVLDPMKEILHVQADRTGLLDVVAKAIRKQHISFSGYELLESALITHLRNMVRDEEPETPAEWRKLSPQDHLFHSIGFMLSAVKLKRLHQMTMEVPQSVVMVQGVDNNAFTTNILGDAPKKRSEWQNRFLLR